MAEQQSPQPQPAQPSQNVVFTFVGPITPQATKSVRNACCTVVNQKTQRLIIQFSSNGGQIDEGFALYAFLRSLPLELTMHAIGAVESIAAIVFLAADRRLANPQSHFMIHSFSWPFFAQQYETQQIDNIQKSLKNSESKYINVIENRTHFTANDFMNLNALEKVTFLNAATAKEKNFIHDIAEAKIPSGWGSYNIDYEIVR